MNYTLRKNSSQHVMCLSFCLVSCSNREHVEHSRGTSAVTGKAHCQCQVAFSPPFLRIRERSSKLEGRFPYCTQLMIQLSQRKEMRIRIHQGTLIATLIAIVQGTWVQSSYDFGFGFGGLRLKKFKKLWLELFAGWDMNYSCEVGN